MKQRTSFILKGLVSLVLSLIMLCGTAVTSLSAVTVDIAETGVTGELDTSKTYNVGIQNGTVKYNLIYKTNAGITNSSGWVVEQLSTEKFLNSNGFSVDRPEAQTYDVLSKAIVLESEYDAGSNTYYFKGYYPDARGNPVEWYLYWRANAQEAWLGHGKTGSGIPGDVVIDPDPPTPSTYNVTVEQKVTNNDIDFTTTTAAATITSNPATITGLSSNTEVTLTQTPNDGYTFLGWYSDDAYISRLGSCTFTVTADKTVEARYTTNPTKGNYKFKYMDRSDLNRASEEKIKTVEVSLNGAEMVGYSGNGNQAGVPTYIWNADSQSLFSKNPLLTASLSVQGGSGAGGTGHTVDDVSVYKNDIEWDLEDANKRSVDDNQHCVTVTADSVSNKFIFKYMINGETLTEGASQVPYGKVVTFNPVYADSTTYQYIKQSNGDPVNIPSENFSYWSSDAAGNNILTTNRTFGMILRGGSGVWDEASQQYIVTVYAQYNKTVSDDDMAKWFPEFEEATLTRTISDTENLFYSDYMTNYFNYRGDVIQDLIENGAQITYGLLIMKSNVEISDDKMQTVLRLMRENRNVMNAKIGDDNHIAYRREFSDGDHISNFNRALYTIKYDPVQLKGKRLTAMAYITVNGQDYYSAVNTALSAIDAQ